MNPVGLHSHEDKLLDFAYGELPDAEARAMEAHVKGCHRCAGNLENLRGVRATMAKLTPEPPPEQGLESLLAYAQQAARRVQETPAKKPPPSWYRWLLPLTGVLAFSLIGVVAVQSFKESKAPEASAQVAVAERPKERRLEPTPNKYPDKSSNEDFDGASNKGSYDGQRDKAQEPNAIAEAKRADTATTGQRVLPKTEAGGALAVEVESPRAELAAAPAAPAKDAKAVSQSKSKKEWISARVGGLDSIGGAPSSAQAGAARSAPADEERQAFLESTSKVRRLSESQVAAGPPANAAPAPMQVAQAPALDDRAGSGLSMRGGKASVKKQVLDESVTALEAGEDVSPARIAAKGASLPKADAQAQPAEGVAEAQKLRQAVASNPPRAELEKLLIRLCNVEVEHGLEATGCERLIRDFPQSPAAQVAQRRLAAPAEKSAAPAAAKPATPAPARPADAVPQKRLSRPQP